MSAVCWRGGSHRYIVWLLFNESVEIVCPWPGGEEITPLNQVHHNSALLSQFSMESVLTDAFGSFRYGAMWRLHSYCFPRSMVRLQVVRLKANQGEMHRIIYSIVRAGKCGSIRARRCKASSRKPLRSRQLGAGTKW